MIRKRLWAPWRAKYLASMKTPSKAGSRSCLFCLKGKPTRNPRDRILTRGRFGYSLLNRFPYNNGHLLVAPYRHVGNLESLTREEWLEILELASDAIRRLRQALRPDGFNLGVNIGRAAGVGVPGHLHLHIVPRWVGDTNFMPILAETKVISQSLSSTHRLLRAGFKRARVKR